MYTTVLPSLHNMADLPIMPSESKAYPLPTIGRDTLRLKKVEMKINEADSDGARSTKNIVTHYLQDTSKPPQLDSQGNVVGTVFAIPVLYNAHRECVPKKTSDGREKNEYHRTCLSPCYQTIQAYVALACALTEGSNYQTRRMVVQPEKVFTTELRASSKVVDSNGSFLNENTFRASMVCQGRLGFLVRVGLPESVGSQDKVIISIIEVGLQYKAKVDQVAPLIPPKHWSCSFLQDTSEDGIFSDMMATVPLRPGAVSNATHNAGIVMGESARPDDVADQALTNLRTSSAPDSTQHTEEDHVRGLLPDEADRVSRHSIESIRSTEGANTVANLLRQRRGASDDDQ